MKDKIFLACFDRGVTRAACTHGEWQVQQLAREHQVSCIAADPSNPQRIYGGTSDGILFSEDSGLTWHQRGLKGKIIKSLAVSPLDSSTVYAGTKPAYLYKSQDNGSSWSELTGFREIPNRWWWFSPAEKPWKAYVLSIALSPRDPQVLLAGIEFGAVVRSEDGGNTWSAHRSGALRDSHSLKFHHHDRNWVYQAGGTGGGAAFSRDGGQSFHKAKRGLKKHYGIVCAADPRKPEIWYICVGSSPMNAFSEKAKVYLYRAAGGAGWQPIGWQPHPLTQTPTVLITLADAPGHLYAGLYNGHIYHTQDHGDSWRRLPFNMGGIWSSLLVLPHAA